MFNFLKKKAAAHILASPCNGNAVKMTEVNDPTFSAEMLGKGAAVVPADGKIVSPCDGTITMLFNTLHAVGITSADGIEVLLHVGIDTVNLKGNGFTAHVKQGDMVKRGDLLLTADLDVIKAAGYDPTVMMVVTNTGDFASVESSAPCTAVAGNDLVTVKEK